MTVVNIRMLTYSRVKWVIRRSQAIDHVFVHHSPPPSFLILTLSTIFSAWIFLSLILWPWFALRDRYQCLLHNHGVIASKYRNLPASWFSGKHICRLVDDPTYTVVATTQLIWWRTWCYSMSLKLYTPVRTNPRYYPKHTQTPRHNMHLVPTWKTV